MAVLARSCFKGLLFFSLFFFSIRYVYALLLFFPPWNQHYSYSVSEFLGFHDIEFFDALFGVVTSLIMATFAYTVVMKIWRRYRSKQRPALEH